MMEQCSPKIFIFTALECEAKALVNKFKLKKENIRHPFSIYRGDKIVLTVTGVGKVAMAAGVAYTSAVFPGLESPVMINIGIAGHKTQSVGRLLMASKIVDVDSEKVFYPQLVGANWPETSEIKTMALPSTKYYLDCLNDMEASAFYETAVRFSSCELIHCIKVVSDNGESSIESINSKVEQEKRSINQALPKLTTQKENRVPTGGLMQQITNAATNTNTTHVENLTVSTTEKVDGYRLYDELKMAAG